MDNRLLLLGLLRQHAMHGYELIGFIEGPMGACTDVKKAAAYFLLDKMAQEGLVVARDEREGNRPIRRVFAITPDGEIEFQSLLRQNLSAFDKAVLPGDASIAFLDNLPAREAVTLLSQRRVEMSASLERAENAPSHPGALQFLIDHQIHYLKSELAWLDHVIEQVSASAEQTRARRRPHTTKPHSTKRSKSK